MGIPVEDNFPFRKASRIKLNKRMKRRNTASYSRIKGTYYTLDESAGDVIPSAKLYLIVKVDLN